MSDEQTYVISVMSVDRVGMPGCAHAPDASQFPVENQHAAA
jgi:hypothetical protein